MRCSGRTTSLVLTLAAGCGGFGGPGGSTFPLTGTAAPGANVAPAGPLGFTADVLPILQQNCVVCHGPGGVMQAAPLTNLAEVTGGTTRLGNAPPSYVVPGQPGQSLLVVKTTVPGTMSVHLTTVQAQVLRDWIQQGALDGAAAPAGGGHP